jgi:hypothetical protein
MTAFIFQGNPNDFDIDGYLAGGREKIIWKVNQCRDDIVRGNQVFIWRALGNRRHGPAGIVAECLVDDSKVDDVREDEFAIPFWRVEQDYNARRPRVWLQVIRVAESGKILDRDTIRGTPALEKVGPLGFTQGTNFKLSGEEARRLNALWQATFPVHSDAQARQEFDRRAAVWEKVSMERLLAEYGRGHAIGSQVPRRMSVTTVIFERDPLVKAIARQRAGFRCEVPDCLTPSFPSKFAEPYCEVHHLTPLAENGEDTIENVRCVCANHHKELHFGKRHKELAELLRSIRS